MKTITTNKGTKLKIVRCFYRNDTAFVEFPCIDCGELKVAAYTEIMRETSFLHRKCAGLRMRKERMQSILRDRNYIIGVAYTKTRYGARVRNIEFALTREEIGLLIFNCCSYCGDNPEYTSGGRVHKFIGIDRVDNNKGYTMDNCVPCCKMCNIAKGNHSYEEFMHWIKKIGMFNIDKVLSVSSIGFDMSQCTIQQ